MEQSAAKLRWESQTLCPVLMDSTRGSASFLQKGSFFFIQGADFAAGKGKQHAKFKRENSFLHWPL